MSKEISVEAAQSLALVTAASTNKYKLGAGETSEVLPCLTPFFFTAGEMRPREGECKAIKPVKDTTPSPGLPDQRTRAAGLEQVDVVEEGRGTASWGQGGNSAQ